MLLKWNPKKFTGSYQGRVGNRDFAVGFVAYMDDTAIEAKYDEARVTKHAGMDGVHTFVLNVSKGAQITIYLSQGSPSNDQLSDLTPDAARNFMPVGVLTFDDLNGTTKIKTAEAVIAEVAEIVIGKVVKGRKWVFECGETDIHVGSAGDF